jgi:hypothetical protein
MAKRARKLQNYFTQPFFIAEPYYAPSGTHVGLDEALRTCRDILKGRLDDIPMEAFYLPAASRRSGCREAWFGLHPPGGTGKAGLAQRPTCGFRFQFAKTPPSARLVVPIKPASGSDHRCALADRGGIELRDDKAGQNRRPSR